MHHGSLSWRLPALLALTFASVMPGIVSAQQTESPPRCSEETFDTCLNGVSSTVTGFDSLRVSTSALAASVAATDDQDDGRAGFAAALAGGIVARVRGDVAPLPIGGWVSYLASRFETAYIGEDGATNAAYDGDLDTLLLAFDRLLAGGGTVGATLLIESRETRTFYNGGGEDGDGLGINLFGVHPVGATARLDWVLGYAGTRTDQARIDPQDGSRIRASYDARRWFAASNFGAGTEFATAWHLDGRIGLLYAAETADGYTENGGPSARTVQERETSLLQGVAGIELGWLRDAFEPYAGVGYRRDLSREDGREAGGLPGSVGATQPDDRDEFEVMVGLRHYGRTLSLSVEWLRTMGRDRFDNDSLTLLLRGEF